MMAESRRQAAMLCLGLLWLLMLSGSVFVLGEPNKAQVKNLSQERTQWSGIFSLFGGILKLFKTRQKSWFVSTRPKSRITTKTQMAKVRSWRNNPYCEGSVSEHWKRQKESRGSTSKCSQQRQNAHWCILRKKSLGNYLEAEEGPSVGAATSGYWLHGLCWWWWGKRAPFLPCPLLHATLCTTRGKVKHHVCNTMVLWLLEDMDIITNRKKSLKTKDNVSSKTC